jgi:hypothetical protein
MTQTIFPPPALIPLLPRAFLRTAPLQLSLFSFQRFSFFSSLSLPRAPTAWPHEVSPCAACLDVLHSLRTLARVLDTDSGAATTREQGPPPVFTSMNEAWQPSYASKHRRNQLEINGRIDGFGFCRCKIPRYA